MQQQTEDQVAIFLHPVKLSLTGKQGADTALVDPDLLAAEPDAVQETVAPTRQIEGDDDVPCKKTGDARSA